MIAMHNGQAHLVDGRSATSGKSSDRLRFQSETNDDKQSVLKRNIHNLDTHSNLSTSNMQPSIDGKKESCDSHLNGSSRTGTERTSGELKSSNNALMTV